jgi:pantothenate kinase
MEHDLVSLLTQLITKHVPSPLVVGIVGCPGAGKSTLASILALQLESQGISCLVVPMDGFHLYKHQLAVMSDPALAFKRRGSPWTFDPQTLVIKLRLVLERNQVVKFPSFDHSKGDPVEDDIVFDPKRHKVVLVEGNYLLLKSDPEWAPIAELLHHKLFLDVPEVVLRKRLEERHMEAWRISREEAISRIETNDLLNARLIVETKMYADQVISPFSELSD